MTRTRVVYLFCNGKVTKVTEPLRKPSFNDWQKHIRKELRKSLYPVERVENVLIAGYDSDLLKN